MSSIIVSTSGNRLIVLTNPDKAIEYMGPNYQVAFRELTFEELVTRVYIRDHGDSVPHNSTLSADEMIDTLKHSVTVLGMKNVDEEVRKAVAEFSRLDQVSLMKRLIPFNQWGT